MYYVRQKTFFRRSVICFIVCHNFLLNYIKTQTDDMTLGESADLKFKIKVGEITLIFWIVTYFSKYFLGNFSDHSWRICIIYTAHTFYVYTNKYKLIIFVSLLNSFDYRVFWDFPTLLTFQTLSVLLRRFSS